MRPAKTSEVTQRPSNSRFAPVPTAPPLFSSMHEPIVSVLIDETALGRNIMSRDSWKRLRAIARVRFRPAGAITPTHMRSLVRGADAVITSWGTPRFDAEYLDLAPDL